MTTKTHDDLAAICERLSEQLAKIDRAINEKTAHIGELQSELASIARNKANYSGDLEHTRTMVSQAQSALTQATTDAQLSKGTTIAKQKADELTAAREQLKRAEAQLAILQQSLEHDSASERDTGAAIASLQGEIAALQVECSDLAQTRQRFSTEQANHVRTLGLEMLTEIDSEIASLQAKLDQARSYREDALRKFARDLAPWPDLAVSTLAEVAHFAPGPDARLLSAWLDMLSALGEASPNAQRMALFTIPLRQLVDYGGLQAYRESQERAKITHDAQYGGAVIADPALQRLEQHVATVERVLFDLQAKQQEVSAAALLSEVQQTSSS